MGPTKLKRAISILAVLLGLLWAQPAWAQFTIKAHTSCGGSDSGFTAKCLIDSTGADLIVFCAEAFSFGTLSDSQSLTWSTAVTSSGVGNPDSRMRYALTGGSTSATHTFTTTDTFSSGSVLAVSGVDTGTPLDGSGTQSESASSTSQAPGSITPTATNNLWVTCAASNSINPAVPGTPSGFSVDTITDHTAAGNHYASGIGWLAQTSTTAQNPAWTLGSANRLMVAGQVFKGTGGGASPTTHPCGNLLLLGVGCEAPF